MSVDRTLICEHYIQDPEQRCMLCFPKLRSIQTHSGDEDRRDPWGGVQINAGDEPLVREENPLVSLQSALAFDSRDWSVDRRDAWIYGIVQGWDGAMEEVAAKHGWTAETQVRLARLNRRYLKAKEELALDLDELREGGDESGA